MSGSYSALVAALSAWPENDATEYTTQIDTFIDLGELRLSRDLRVPAFWRHQSAAFTTGEPFINKPSDCVNVRHISYVNGSSERVFLEKVDDDQIMTYYPTRTTQGAPRFYAQWDYDYFLVQPAPDSTYTFEIAYSARLDALSTSNETNWITENAYDALLFASLIEAAGFMMNVVPQMAGMLPIWQQKYVEAVQAVNAEASGIQRDSLGGPFQLGQPASDDR